MPYLTGHAGELRVALRGGRERHDGVLHGLLCVFVGPCRLTLDLLGELSVVDGDRRLADQRSQELHFFAGQSVSLGCVEGEDAKNLFLRDQWHAKVGDEAVSSVEDTASSPTLA